MSSPPARPESAVQVLWIFLRLGMTSFGGPIAHLGYFRTEFVSRRRWLSDSAYAELVALCQFLPGPASSQAGFAMGWLRAGPLGALAAFVGFTLPSTLAMLALALGAGSLGGPIGQGLAMGLKLAAVAIVAQAVIGMARSLTPDLQRLAIAAGAAGLSGLAGGSAGQIGAIVLGALAGLVLCRPAPATPAMAALAIPISRALSLAALGLFALLLVGLPLLAAWVDGGAVPRAEAFFRAGALVFGGGHVVLPLLEAGIVQPGWVQPEAFLAGYGAAQALPGPLFAFAAYLGALTGPLPAIPGGLMALAMMFLPGLLLLVGVLPWWQGLRARPWAGMLMRGTNAAVVGILAAALVHPVGSAALTGWPQAVLAALLLALLLARRMNVGLVVALAAAGGLLLSLVA